MLSGKDISIWKFQSFHKDTGVGITRPRGISLRGVLAMVITSRRLGIRPGVVCRQFSMMSDAHGKRKRLFCLDPPVRASLSLVSSAVFLMCVSPFIIHRIFWFLLAELPLPPSYTLRRYTNSVEPAYAISPEFIRSRTYVARVSMVTAGIRGPCNGNKIDWIAYAFIYSFRQWTLVNSTYEEFWTRQNLP